MGERQIYYLQETRRASISDSVAADKAAPAPPGSIHSESQVKVNVQVHAQVQVQVPVLTCCFQEITTTSLEEENVRLKQLNICKVCLDAEVRLWGRSVGDNL